MAKEGNEEREQLLELAQQGRVSLAELSRMLGRNPSYLQQYVRKGSPRKLEEGDRRKLAQFFGVKETVLGAENGFDLGGAEGAKAAEPYVAIPRLMIDASAGPGALNAQGGTEENSFDAYRFSRRWLREMGLEGADLSAIRVEGDSMEPVLRSGDDIFVDRNKRAGEGVHVVRLGEGLHVKQVQVSAPGRIKLVSANPAYPPIDLERDEVEIIGRVVWKGGRV
jgi:phage repressor protein C with HTH and peptisase S24 domain